MAVELCKKCGKNIALVGIRHNCNPPIEMEVMPHSAARNLSSAGRDKTRPQVVVKELSPGACPVCEARRVKQLEAQKRYRSKLRKI